LIKKHSTTEHYFFEARASEKDFPLSLNQLNDLIKEPSDFAGMAAGHSGLLLKRLSQLRIVRSVRLN
jgi:adenylosuccinate lyase